MVAAYLVGRQVCNFAGVRMTAQLPEPLVLSDLGVTVDAEPDGTATIDLGWFGKKTITIADRKALEAWLKLLPTIREPINGR